MQQDVQDVPVTSPRFDFQEWFQTGELLKLAGIVYLLRVPILLFLIAAFMTVGGLVPNGPGTAILEGIYDVAWPPSNPGFVPELTTVLRFLLLTVSALMFASTLAVGVRNILRCIERFRIEIGDEDTPAFRGMRVLYTVPPIVLALAIIIGVTLTSQSSEWASVSGDVLGCVVFGFLFGAGAQFRHPNPKGFLIFSGALILSSFSSLNWNGRIVLLVLTGIVALVQIGLFRVANNPKRWVTVSHIGYTDKNGLKGHHLVAAHAFSLSLMLYGTLFVLKSGSTNSFPSEYPLIPTLAMLLILGNLLCWTFSGISFFLDHYRIPLILPIVVYSWFASSFPQSDHFYRIYPAEPAVSVPAADLLDGDSTRPPVLLVAITGGGIRASAWSARVLRAVQLQSGDEERFLSSVRLISSVSGGSVGAMYFADAYTNGDRHAKKDSAGGVDESDPVLARAQSSSLDEIAVELAYQDTLLGLASFLRGLDYHDGRAFLRSGRFIFQDRGAALEDAIKRGPQIADAMLRQWRDDAKQLKRPAVILNSTIVESGKRLLFATTDMPDASTGRIQFAQRYPLADVRVATAARLSATFPFVSPAARPMLESVSELSDHAVDGGYADNYGMASLVEWLDRGLSDLKTAGRTLPPKIMILEIRSSSATMDQSHDNKKGFLFQMLNPLLTIANVREAGQLSHNELERDLVKHRWAAEKVTICSVVFQTPRDNRVEPLNWHLTLGDIGALKRAWGADSVAGAKQVAAYLRGENEACR
jgi:hypothetical protein